MATSVVPKQLSILDVYPVGAIYISVSAIPPDELFGGTWEAFGTGRTLVSIDTGDTDFATAELTGGEKTHTLSSSEMPWHTHYSYLAIGGPTRSNINAGAVWCGGGIDPGSQTSGSGGSQAHNNLQPYITNSIYVETYRLKNQSGEL